MELDNSQSSPCPDLGEPGENISPSLAIISSTDFVAFRPSKHLTASFREAGKELLVSLESIVVLLVKWPGGLAAQLVHRDLVRLRYVPLQSLGFWQAVRKPNALDPSLHAYLEKHSLRQESD